MSNDELMRAMEFEASSGRAASAGDLPAAVKSGGTSAKPPTKPATKANLAQIPKVATEEAFCDANLRKAAS